MLNIPSIEVRTCRGVPLEGKNRFPFKEVAWLGSFLSKERHQQIRGGGGGQPQKTHSFSKIAKWVFLTFFFWVFLGLNF